MLSGFPQLDSLLKQRGGINQSAQQQQPDQFQQMPQTGPSKGFQPQPVAGGFAQPMQAQPVQAEYPTARPMLAQQQPAQPAQPVPDARPLGGFSNGVVKQGMFNQAQQAMNARMPGGKFNKRRF